MKINSAKVGSTNVFPEFILLIHRMVMRMKMDGYICFMI